MTVRELLDVCDDTFKIELCNRIEMYGTENYVTIAYRRKPEILEMLDNNENGMGEIGSKEVKAIRWHILNESCLLVAF